MRSIVGALVVMVTVSACAVTRIGPGEVDPARSDAASIVLQVCTQTAGLAIVDPVLEVDDAGNQLSIGFGIPAGQNELTPEEQEILDGCVERALRAVGG